MTLPEFFQSICERIKEFFYASYGDRDNSKGIYTTVTGTNWLPVISVPVPSVAYIRNMSTADELEICFNDENVTGMMIKKDLGLVLDKVSGDIYARPVDSTKTVSLNIYVVALRTNF